MSGTAWAAGRLAQAGLAALARSEEAFHYKLTFGSAESTVRTGGELAAGLEIALPDRFRSELCLVERV